MKLSKTSAQAALAMAYLATRTDAGFVQARTVAEHLGIPTDSSLKILQALARRGLIASQLGRSGGYRLAKPPVELSLLEIVQAIDGPIVGETPLQNGNPANAEVVDMLRAICEHTADRIRQELGRTSVADLAAGERPAEPHGNGNGNGRHN